MTSRISAIACHLPDRVVSNRDLMAENPAWNMSVIEQRAGVHSRHIARDGETAFDLAKQACDKLFSAQGQNVSSIDAIIFCTQTPDYIMPPNAHLLHKHLRMPDAVSAFDINLACSGYIYGLAIAHSFIHAGVARRVLLATADTYSRYIHPGDRSARVLFGDGAAVSVIERGGEDGLSVFDLASNGEGYDKFFIPAGGQRLPLSPDTKKESIERSGNVRTPEHIHMDGFAVWSFINSAVPKQILAHLQKRGTTLQDMDQFIFHQASRMTLESLIKILKIPEAKVPMNLGTVGNTVSASIPMCLAQAIRDDRIRRGDRVLLSGFGVGLSYGTTSFRYESDIDVY
jgi:3-oxoacyl-[acyl-carrier-protein] synthase-3